MVVYASDRLYVLSGHATFWFLLIVPWQYKITLTQRITETAFPRMVFGLCPEQGI